MEKIERLNANVALKRADELCVGDVILDSGFRFENKDGTISSISPPRLTTVWDLGLVGDDVIVNGGAITTSIGNRFLIVVNDKGEPVRSWQFPDELG